MKSAAPLRQLLPSIGRLDRRIDILEHTQGTDFAGGETITWSVKAHAWAHMVYQQVGTQEAYTGDGIQQVATQTVTFTIRFLDGVTAKMRIQYDSELYDIEQIAELGRKMYLSITCKKRD